MFVAPRLRTLESGEPSRRATWLELFFDLVYVVVVAALANELARDPTPAGALRFAALFVPVWWSWVGFTIYNDRFDTEDVGQRALTLLAMLGAASLAVAIRDAFRGPAFALSYVFLRALLLAQYLRVARHVPLARALSVHYAAGFGAAALLWGAAILAPAPWRYAMWAVAMAIDVGTPLVARAHQAKLPVSTSHLPERVGLFTILVLGEAISAIVRGVGSPSPAAFVGGALGLTIAFSFWWVYFENAERHLVRRSPFAGRIWFYAHLPLVMGIAAAAVGVEGLVGVATGEPLGDASRWILGGGVALCLGALGAIHATTVERSGAPRPRARALVRVASAVLTLALTSLAGGLPGLAFGIALAIVCVAQVALDPAKAVPQAAS